MRQSLFCLIQRPYISKLCLPGRISPVDHHNKMLRPWPLRGSARITNTFDGGVSRLHGFKSQRGVDYPFQFAADRIQSRCSGN